MKENDPLNSILREWKAPEPSAELDARVRAAYRAAVHPPLWRRVLSLRVTIPVPVLAALLLVVAGWMLLRGRAPTPSVPASIPSPAAGYTTRIETAGFHPLPDGAVRIIRSGESRK